MGDDVPVGVLSLHNDKETKAICNAVEAPGHEPVWLRAEKMTIATRWNRARVDPEPDVVVTRALLPSATELLTTLGLVAAVGATDVPVLNPSTVVATAVRKSAVTARLASAGVPVPASALGIGTHRLERFSPPTDRRSNSRPVGGNAGARNDEAADETEPFAATRSDSPGDGCSSTRSEHTATRRRQSSRAATRRR